MIPKKTANREKLSEFLGWGGGGSGISGTSVWRPQSRYTVSRIECRIKKIPSESEMSRQNRATPPQIKVSHLSLDPPVALSSHWQQAGGAAGLVEGIAALLGSESGSRYRGVSQLQSHQSRYSVQLRGPSGIGGDRVGRCARVLHFMGREVTGRYKYRMKAVQWVVMKFSGR